MNLNSQTQPQNATTTQQMPHDVTILSNAYMNPQAWDQMKEMAKMFHQSGAISKCYDNVFKVITALQAGYEMGMKPMESLQSLYIVNGSVNIWGKAVVRRLREHGWSINYTMHAERGGGCTAVVTKGIQTFTDTLYFDQVERSGSTKDHSGTLKFGWREGKNRLLKLRYGVIDTIIRTYIPEVLGSVAHIQEIGEDFQDQEPVAIETVEQAETKKQDDLAALKELKETMKKTHERVQNQKQLEIEAQKIQ